jgi:site-specific recombinase XerC
VTNERDLAIIMCLTSSGLRLSSLVRLDRDSVKVEVADLGDGVKRTLGVGRVISKGDREIEFMLDVPALHQLHRYLASRADSNPAMFISNRGGRMSPRAVQHMIRAWCRRLNLPMVHPHQFRHHFATMLHKLGVGLLDISQMLSHASVATTQIYVKPDQGRIRAEYFASRELLHSPGESKLPDQNDQNMNGAAGGVANPLPSTLSSNLSHT